MGRLIKNHLARLIILTAAAYQLLASIFAFFFPKILFDFSTKNLDGAVKPVPYLQIVNFLLALVTLAYEWPIGLVAGTTLQQSIEARVAWLPLCATAAALIYQGTNAALYYVIGVAVYAWAYVEGEVICPTPWMLPRRKMHQVKDV
ncbi:hypothetical protein K470DRAFT_238295 [Piedraia hortae CBS 480.64]|uniref:DUF7727 domain-containing protein n=1 Tax=Piedraia hortae CBS 480.64 TaxID=1314780 RepID=A0A6A7BQK4_9PEZI|nr:hypothetical protein K470DRAFT_238295 [Piedraia hortae CBS 480.64]